MTPKCCEKLGTSNISSMISQQGQQWSWLMSHRRTEHLRVELQVPYLHCAALVTMQLMPFFLVSHILFLSGQEGQQQKGMVLMPILLLPSGHQEHYSHPQGHFINHPLTNQNKMKRALLLKLVRQPVLALCFTRIILWNWLGALHFHQVILNKTQMNKKPAQRIFTPQIWSLLTRDWDQKGSKNWNTGKLILYRVQIPLGLYTICWCCQWMLPFAPLSLAFPWESHFCAILELFLYMQHFKKGGRGLGVVKEKVKLFVIQ